VPILNSTFNGSKIKEQCATKNGTECSLDGEEDGIS